MHMELFIYMFRVMTCYLIELMHLQLCPVRETRFMKDTDEMVHTVPYTGELYKFVYRINFGFSFMSLCQKSDV
jgi:hypothetical protein